LSNPPSPPITPSSADRSRPQTLSVPANSANDWALAAGLQSSVALNHIGPVCRCRLAVSFQATRLLLDPTRNSISTDTVSSGRSHTSRQHDPGADHHFPFNLKSGYWVAHPQPDHISHTRTRDTTPKKQRHLHQLGIGAVVKTCSIGNGLLRRPTVAFSPSAPASEALAAGWGRVG
jgi:hypothetical protein